MSTRLSVLALLLPIACSHGSDPAPANAPLILAAGLQELPRQQATTLADPVDLGRLGVGRVDGVYKLTTPAGRPFRFDVVTTAPMTTGAVRVSLAHAADAGAVPGDERSLAAAGFVPNAAGVQNRGDGVWLDASGDGFARLTVQGSITQDQVLALATETGEGSTTVLVEIDIGSESPINIGDDPASSHPGVVLQQTLYSSDSGLFGAPVLAVSGDRSSVVVYEGDQALAIGERRYELRLQHDAATGAVTGGGQHALGSDTGNWRDHEAAALYNVLAVVRAGYDGADLSLSFDRGASFAQTVQLDLGSEATRLCQCSMAADYSLAVVFWRNPAGSEATELVLVEGRPAGFDPHGSPDSYRFDAPQVLASVEASATPLISGVEWSTGGDLVVGYAYSRNEAMPGMRRTFYRCATRRYGEPIVDRPVDEDVIIAMDPSVALLGSGAGLRIFYAYETSTGIRLRTSDDGGQSFGLHAEFAEPGAVLPKVFARQSGNRLQVDVLYQALHGAGNELHHSRWLDWPGSPREDWQLTRAELVLCAHGGGNGWTGPIDFGFRLRQLGWFGYDAVLDGDQIVVVLDEETYDSWFLWFGGPRLATTGGLSWPIFSPAQPPPLAPGMTEPVRAPDPGQRHQLKLLRLQ